MSWTGGLAILSEAPFQPWSQGQSRSEGTGKGERRCMMGRGPSGPACVSMIGVKRSFRQRNKEIEGGDCTYRGWGERWRREREEVKRERDSLEGLLSVMRDGRSECLALRPVGLANLI